MMKVAILAGGLGTRLSEETTVKPKPMVEIGGKPILWHIMNIYAAYGFKEFVVALGYRGEVIKDYFLNYHYRSRSLTIQLKTGGVIAHNRDGEDWTVHLLDTGIDSQTGGRVKRIAEFLGGEPFMLTYGDGVGNINIAQLLQYHQVQGGLSTITAVRPPARFGQMIFDSEEQVTEFVEKPQLGEGWINGGFFVVQPEIVEYIDGDQTIFEREPLERLALDGQLKAFRHPDFWYCMDTLRDVQLLNKLWEDGKAPWKTWK
jgi:glucose-1-phosphate cytidylyltransferase